jgi:hypothetical protein
MNFLPKNLRAFSAVVAAGIAATLLTGCASTVSLEAAPDANNPRCAEVSVRLPHQIEALERRQTDAQATGAWGNPAAVISRCGLPQVLISTLPCVTAGGVDWLVDDSAKPSYRFISFARNPATEVIVDSKLASGATALDAIGPAVARIAATKVCLAKTN